MAANQGVLSALIRRERSKKVVEFSAMALVARHTREVRESPASPEDLTEREPSRGSYRVAQQRLSAGSR